MNQRFEQRFPGRAAERVTIGGSVHTNAADFLQHGGHLTAMESTGWNAVNGDRMIYGKMGAPGSVTVFGNESGVFTMKADQFRSFALDHGQDWHPTWDMPQSRFMSLGMVPFNTIFETQYSVLSNPSKDK